MAGLLRVVNSGGYDVYHLAFFTFQVRSKGNNTLKKENNPK